MLKEHAHAPAIVMPPVLDQHPEWRAHVSQLRQRQDAAGRSTVRLRELEAARAEAATLLGDGQVSELLGDTGARVSVAALRERLSESERHLAAAREQLDVEEHAVQRLEQRGVELRVRLHRETRDAVDRTHHALLEAFGAHLAALQPILQAIRDLRGAHPSAFEASRVPPFDELLVRLPGSKGGDWLREARAVDIDVDA